MSEPNVPNFDQLSDEARQNIRDRVFRVYIESTFSDMQQERDELVQNVFPRFRRLCKERGVEFVPIDLRWGITAEQAIKGQTVGICLRESLRSSFFIGLVGKRYGWVPQLGDICTQDLDDFPFLENDVKNGLSITETIFQFGALRRASQVECGFWLRSENMETSENFQEKNAPEKLAQFKEQLLTQKKYPVAEYDSPTDLGTQVEKVLISWLDKYFPELEEITWLEKQNFDQNAFEKSLKRLYFENPDDYKKLNTFVKSKEQTLVVVGASGLGKSALLANWKDDCKEQFKNTEVYTHYVSASENSDQPVNILRRLIELIDSVFTSEKEPQHDLESYPKTLDDFSNEFTTAVNKYLSENPEKRLLFIIDGLNHLSETDNAKELAWLPPLPERSQYVLSTVVADSSREAIKRMGWNCYQIYALDRTRREKIIKRILTSRGKALTSVQERRISRFLFSAIPLVLRTLLDELCVFGTYENIDQEIDRYTESVNVVDFFSKIFVRLDFNERFIVTDSQKRKEIVEKLSLLLALSRYGLSEEELCCVANLSKQTVSTFLRMLDAQLIMRSGRYSFAHDFIRQAVLERYKAKIVDTRRLLIDEFLKLNPKDERRLQEIPFQYMKLESWEELSLFLLDFDVLKKLYNGTFHCDFCTYWNVALKNRRKEFQFASYLKLETSDPANWYKLANIADEYKEYVTAEKAYQNALKIWSKLAETSTEVYLPYRARTLNNLANLHSNTYRFAEAEKEYKEALAIQRQLSAESPKVYTSELATTLDNLANLHSNTYDFDDAKKEYEEALIMRRQLADEKPNLYKQYVADTLNNLANLYSNMNRLDKAEEKYKEALEILLQLSVKKNDTHKPHIAGTLNNLGILYSNTDRLVDAEKEYEIALVIRRQLAEENPNLYKQYVADTLNNLAVLYSNMNRPEDAEKRFKEALEIRRQLVEENPNAYKRYLADTLNNLANFYVKINRPDDAEKGYKEALVIRRQLVEETPNAYKQYVANILSNLASLHSDMNRFDKAEEEYEQALVIRRQLAEEKPNIFKPRVADSLNDLGILHSNTNRLNEAEKECREALEIRKQLAKKNPSVYKPEFVKTLNNLAVIHSNMIRLDDTEKEYKEVLEKWRELAKKKPNIYEPYVADALFNISILYSRMGKNDDVIPNISEAITIYEKVKGGNPVYKERLENAYSLRKYVSDKCYSPQVVEV